MDDSTKTMMLTLASGVIKKGLITLGATAATHGIISANQTETFVAVGMFAVGAAWSFWNDYGKAIVLSKLEVLKAQSLAQAAKLKAAGVAAPSATEIAAQHPTLTPSDVVKQATIVKVLLMALALSLLAFPGLAMAQVKPLKPLVLKPLIPVPVPSPAAATQGPADALSKFMDDLAKIQATVVTGVIADLTAADADAATLTNASDPTSFRDPISHACYPAAVKFLQSLPVATPTTGEFVLAQLFQKKRDFVAQIQAGIPVYLKLGCAPLVGDEATIFAKLMGLIGVQVGLNTIAPGLGLAIPAFP